MKNLQAEIDAARTVCVLMHAGDFRRDGVTPYHTHPFAVADRVPYELKPAAYLHDVPEDTTCSLGRLKQSGLFSERTLRAVDSLTRDCRTGEDYDRYIRRVMLNTDAVIIKIEDMKHNLSCNPSPNSVKKIQRWLPVLQEMAYESTRVKFLTEEAHPSGLTGEHSVVLDAIQKECLGG